MVKTAQPPQSADKLPVPAGIEATAFEAEGNAYLIVSYPIPCWHIPDVLSPTEALVARRLLSGETCAQIARARSTAARTVANQIASIFTKLEVKSRLELAAKCVAAPVSENQGD